MIYLLFRKNNKMILSETDIENWAALRAHLKADVFVGLVVKSRFEREPVDYRAYVFTPDGYKTANIHVRGIDE